MVTIILFLLLSIQDSDCVITTSTRWECIQCAWDDYRVCGQDPANDPESCLAKRDAEIAACDDRFPSTPPLPWNPRPHRKPDIEQE